MLPPNGVAHHPPRGCGKAPPPCNQPQSVWSLRCARAERGRGHALVGRRGQIQRIALLLLDCRQPAFAKLLRSLEASFFQPIAVLSE